MADPQLFWGDDALAKWRLAIGHANRLRPAFVVVGGDLLNRNGDAAKVDLARDEERARAYLEAAARLDKAIPLRNVAGNHDVCNRPTPESYAWYEARFGKPWYSFEHGGCLFVVLESDVLKYPDGIPGAAERQLAWLEETLRRARAGEHRHRIVFMHHPVCLKSVDEKDGYFNLRRPLRNRLLALFKETGVGAVFSGHYHGNALVEHEGIQLVTTSAVAKALRGDPPGFRIVKVTPEAIEHAYHGFDNMPERLP
jgi:3',5'-cyclic AMP phosphodiesterase CpdA